MSVHLFPLSEYWWFYLAFAGFVIGLLALDLGVFHRRAHAVSFREAGAWVVVWVSLALTFNWLLYRYALWKFPLDERLLAIPGFEPAAAARTVALEFLTGYIVEESLSIDNLFVFVLIFRYFGIPAHLQHRILYYGILGAIVFRGLFIAAGSYLIQFHAVVVIFGLFLILTGGRMMFGGEQEVHPDRNILIRLFRRFVPVTSEIRGPRFFLRDSGRLVATPLFVTLLCVEATDVVFAVDSVPAIFGITHEPLIVWTSNIFAILGLRALYFVLAGMMDKFHLLRYGLAIVLIFVGLKMVWLNQAFDGKFPITVSLGIIVGVILLAVVLSLVVPPRRGSRGGGTE